MNFRQVATEIMLHAEDEKWYETRDKIESALDRASVAAVTHFCRRGGIRTGSGDGCCEHLSEPELTLTTFRGVALHNDELWRDQPDGVR